MSTTNSNLRSSQVIALIAKRETVQRVKAKSFFVLTALLVVGILGFGVVSRVTGDDMTVVKIGTLQSDALVLSGPVEQTAKALGEDAQIVSYPGASQLQSAVDAGDIDAALVGNENKVVFKKSVDNQTLALLQQSWSSIQLQRSLASAGLSSQEVKSAISLPPLQTSILEGDGENSSLQLLVGTMAAVLLFISLQTFGGHVLMGVVEEKATAVAEVLLVKARSDQLLAGKVIGIGIAALTQFVLAVVAAIAALLISGQDIPTEVWSAVPATLLWFLTGFALYSMLFALAGSLVSRQEDASAASAPIMVVLVAAYFVVFSFGSDPESRTSQILSIIPPIAPILMPVRMAAGSATWYEVVLALVLLLVTIFGVWKMTGRIYDQVLLQRGTRIGWKQAALLLRKK